MKANKATQCLQLTLSTNNDTLVKLAVVFSDVLFTDESLLLHPKVPSTSLTVPLRPPRNQQTELLIKAVVGHRSSTQDHVFELVHTLPRFSSFIYTRPKDINVSVEEEGTAPSELPLRQCHSRSPLLTHHYLSALFPPVRCLPGGSPVPP